MTIEHMILAATVTTTGLITGLLYGYSCSVNPGLGQLNDTAYIAAMQSINKSILNPVFFISFVGTMVLLPVSSFLHYRQQEFILILIASLVYAFGVFGVTVLGNVPLNQMLDRFNITGANAGELKKQRVTFERPWNFMHNVRTVCSVVSFVLIVLACLNRS